jgi:hypothetical protein
MITLIILNHTFLYAELVLTDEQIDNFTLCEIEKMLQANRRSLNDFKPIPFPTDYAVDHKGNQMIYDELNYDKQSLHREFIQLYSSMTGEHFFNLNIS